MKIGKGNQTIESVDDWFRHAPPEKGEKQWVDGRSAKEMARAWLSGESRQRLVGILRPVFGSVTLESAEPECNVAFDEFAGPRQCDLAVQANSDLGEIAIHIEGKADEPFGKLTGEAYDAAIVANALRVGRRKSEVPRRIEGLAENLFGHRLDEAVRRLRYQLLYSAAAAWADASERKSIAAVFVVQELHSPKLDGRKLRQNANDWEAFLRMFPEVDDQHLRLLDTLVGPVHSFQTQWTNVPLYFAKMITKCSSTGTGYLP